MLPDGRKIQVLAAIIEAYIDSGEPVGSKTLVDMLGGGVSSATLRNDMAALTAAGLLEQPHTSAGRQPTDEAFRLYVERLMRRRALTLQDRVDMDTMLSRLSGDATRVLEEACRALADITGLAAIAGRPEQVGSSISRIDLMQMSPRNIAVVLVEDNGFLRTRLCRCQRDIPGKVTAALTEYMSRRFMGQSLDTVTIEAMQEILFELGELGLAVAPILSAFYELAKECAESSTVVAGQMNLLRHPGYDIHRARALVNHLSDRENVTALLSQRDGQGVVLGGTGVLEGSGMVLARYSLGKRGTGTIGVIGPIRMNYADIIPRVDYVAAAVGRLLGELFEETAALDI